MKNKVILIISVSLPVLALLVTSLTFASTSIDANTISTQSLTSSGTLSINGDEQAAMIFSGTPLSAGTSSLIQIGNPITDGTSTGTYFGSNIASFSGNLFDLQIGSTSKFKVDANGNIYIPAEAGYFAGDSIFVPASEYWTASGDDIYSSNSGNVGIGTTTPAYKLDVAGNVNLNNTLYVDGSYVGIAVEIPSSLLEVGTSGYFQFSKTTSGEPSSLDCDADAETGRMVLDPATGTLYVCGGQARGWDNLTLN